MFLIVKFWNSKWNTHTTVDALGLYDAEQAQGYGLTFFTWAWLEPLSTVWDIFLIDSCFSVPSVPQYQKAVCILYQIKAYFTSYFPPHVMHFVAQPVEVSKKCYFYQGLRCVSHWKIIQSGSPEFKMLH